MSIVLYHGGSIISEGLHTCRRTAVVDTLYSSVEGIYRVLKGDGDKQLQDVLYKLQEMNIESDMELVHSVIEEHTQYELESRKPVCIAHAHLKTVLHSLDRGVAALNSRIILHKQKWCRTRRVFCVESEINNIKSMKSRLDHAFDRFITMQKMYLSCRAYCAT